MGNIPSQDVEVLPPDGSEAADDATAECMIAKIETVRLSSLLSPSSLTVASSTALARLAVAHVVGNS